MLAGTSQAIGKRLCGRIVGTSVAPEFVPKRNSELSGSRGLSADDAVRREFGKSATLVKGGLTPAFLLARVLTAVGGGVAASVRKQKCRELADIVEIVLLVRECRSVDRTWVASWSSSN